MSSLRYLLDTNIVSYYIRRTSAALEAKVNDGLRREYVAISVLTRAELKFGQQGMVNDDKRRSLIDGFLGQLPNLPWTEAAADHYAQIRAEHKRKGTPIGEMDALIAAHALAENLSLVTHNTKHFALLPGLKLLDWLG